MTMSPEEQDEQARAYNRIAARAWADAAFKQRLLTEPAAVLKEYGVALAAGMQVQVHEASANVVHFVLPAKAPADLSDAQLDSVAGGFTHGGGFVTINGTGIVLAP